jgi:hypothetical protein
MSSPGMPPSTGDGPSAVDPGQHDDSAQEAAIPFDPFGDTDAEMAAALNQMVAAAREAPEMTFLDQAIALRRLADQIEEKAVFTEKARGASWEEIGNKLGVAKGTAYDRYSKRFRLFSDTPAADEAGPFADAAIQLNHLWGRVAKLVSRRQLQTSLRTAAGSLEPDPESEDTWTWTGHLPELPVEPQGDFSEESAEAVAAEPPHPDESTETQRVKQGAHTQARTGRETQQYLALLYERLSTGRPNEHCPVCQASPTPMERLLADHGSELAEILRWSTSRSSAAPKLAPWWDPIRHGTSHSRTAQRNALVHGVDVKGRPLSSSDARIEELERRQARLEEQVAALLETKIDP